MFHVYIRHYNQVQRFEFSDKDDAINFADLIIRSEYVSMVSIYVGQELYYRRIILPA